MSREPQENGSSLDLHSLRTTTIHGDPPRTSALPDYATKQPRASIRIDPIALATQECITITSAMRKHARWAQSSVSAILGGSAVGSGAPLLTQEKSLLAQNSSRSGTPDIQVIAEKNRIASITRGLPVPDDDSSLASRLGLRSKRARPAQDNPLLSAFSRLRRDLAQTRDITTFDATMLLHPFLQIIRSSSTSATITSLAVISITKFLTYNLISMSNPRIAEAMHLLSAAITHCRFEASDSSADEVVLLRILRLMELMISRPEGFLLPDESICEMMSTGLSMCCQVRLSEVLRRSAEMAMVTMCRIVFSRLEDIEVVDDSQPSLPTRSRSSTLVKPANDQMKINPPLEGSVMGNGAEIRPSTDGRASYEAASSAEKSEPVDSEQIKDEDAEDRDEPAAPYGLPSIRELFRVLIDLLDPNNKQHTVAMRIMALRIIDVALEVSGTYLARQASLAKLVEDDLCRHLFQLSRTDDMVLLNSSLRVATTLLMTCRSVLKLQQELFLSYLIACVHVKAEIPPDPNMNTAFEKPPSAVPSLQPVPRAGTPVPVRDRRQLGLEGGQRRPEAREAMVETIGSLVRIPGFLSELFSNYDCDIDRQDLCEDMVALLSRNALPDAATYSTVNVPPLCLDSLLTFIQVLAERSDMPQSSGSVDKLAHLRLQRTRKRIIKAGAAKFNDDPKAGIAFLAKNGIIKNVDDPVQVAQFLKSTDHVSKKVLGEFLTKKNNPELLKAFIGLFSFDGKRIDEALRELLTSFRLPGESQLIQRISEVFVAKYLASDVPPEVADEDAGFVLTYAIIMLNTDLYNPNVKKTQKRMTLDDFTRNLRGCNAGKDFDQDYLNDIYDAIYNNEIILPDEHDNKNAFDHTWKTMLIRTSTAGPLEICRDNDLDAEMFRATWEPIIATLCRVFLSASDDAVFSRVVVGFDQCAVLAAKYDIPEAFDRIILSLSQVSSLAAETPPSTNLNTEVQVGQRKIMVSELAVRLGRDFRAQLSTVLLFRTLNGHEGAVGETWIYIVRILRNLFVNALVAMPAHVNSSLGDLSPITLQPPSQVIDRDGKLAEGGLFSTFTSYLSSYAADDPPEPSEEELENTLSTMDCVKACHVESVLENLFTLSITQVEKLIDALLSQVPDSPIPVVVVKPDVRPEPVTVRMSMSRRRNSPDYDAGTLFMLELATHLTLRDQETMTARGEILISALESAIKTAGDMHPLATTRILSYILTMLRRCVGHDFIRAPVMLHIISSFSDVVLDNTASAVISGLRSCVIEQAALRNDMTESPDFWSILQRLHQHKTEAEHVFGILDLLTANITSKKGLSNLAIYYESAITLAASYASAASIGQIVEQRRDQALRRGLTAATPDEQTVAVVKRGSQAISIILELTRHAQPLIQQSHLERSEAWTAYYSPGFRALTAQCVNPCREIRGRALSTLQRILLSPDLVTKEDELAGNEWTAIFGEVLFTLVLKLLKPDIQQLDPTGMAETRSLIVGLLCRVFLRYCDGLARIDQRSKETITAEAGEHTTTSNGTSEAEPATARRRVHVLPIIWSRTLELLERLLAVASGKESESLQEAVSESVKNVLLVLADSGYLIRPHSGKTLGQEQRELWKASSARTKNMLPGLLDDLFPEAPVKEDSAPEVEKAEAVSTDVV